MTSHTVTASPTTDSSSRGTRSYWIITGLFCASFTFSAFLTFIDPEAARAEIRHLDFPAYWAYPLAMMKLAGVAVILAGGEGWQRSPSQDSSST